MKFITHLAISNFEPIAALLLLASFLCLSPYRFQVNPIGYDGSIRYFRSETAINLNSNSPQYEIGSTWRFETQTQLTPSQISFVDFTIVDTMTLNDTLAWVFNSGELMHVNDQKVFFYDEGLGHFQLHYDYSDPDMYNLQWSGGCSPPEGVIEVFLDSTGTVDLPNSEPIDVQYLSIFNDGSTSPQPGFQTVYKGIGGEDYIHLVLGQGLCDPTVRVTKLRCFSQGDTSIQFVDYDCDSTWTIIPNSTQELTNQNRLTIFPNPNSGQFSINGIDQIVPTWFSLLDLSGREVVKGRVIDGKMDIDVSSGSYTLRIEQEGKIWMEKLMILSSW